MTKFTTEEVCERVPISLNTLKYCLRNTSFKPTYPSPGKTRRNYYSLSDIEKLKRYKASKPRKEIFND